MKIGSMSVLRNDGSFFQVTVLDGNHNEAQSRSAKSKKDSHKSLPTALRRH